MKMIEAPLKTHDDTTDRKGVFMSISMSGLGDSLMQQYGFASSRTVDAEQTAVKIMRQRDADGDAVLDISEAETLSVEFDETDTDGDSLISFDELIAKINEKLSEVGFSGASESDITGISQLKYMVAKMSVDMLLPASDKSSSGYDFDSLLIDKFNLSGSEANSLIETMKGNPLDVFG